MYVLMILSADEAGNAKELKDAFYFEDGKLKTFTSDGDADSFRYRMGLHAVILELM